MTTATPAAPGRPLTKDEAYAAHGRLISHFARRFHAAYGGDRDQWVSDAAYFFAAAYAKWEPARCPFGKWAGYYIGRQMARRVRRGPAPALTNVKKFDAPAPAGGGLDADEFFSNLSEDAVRVVGMVLANPHRLTTRDAVRRAVLAAGWTAARWRAAFNEVRRAIR